MVRSVGEFSLRLAFCAAAICVAVVAGLNSATNIWRYTRPDVVLRLSPNDAGALTRQQDLQWIASGEMIRQPADMAAVARRALRSEPLDPVAMRQLGLVDADQGQIDRALMLLQLAHKVSRRDLPTLLWSIYGSAASGEIAAALSFADEALSVSPDLGSILMPRLSASLANPAMRAAAVPYLRSDRSWIPELLTYAAGSDRDVANVTRLVMTAGGLPNSWRYQGMNGRILGGLAQSGDFALARAYLHSRGGHLDALLVNPAFAPATIDPELGPFGWSLANRVEMNSLVDEQGSLQVGVSSAQHGRAAVRTLMLAPGTYRFVPSVSFPEGVPRAQAALEMLCPAGKAQRLLWSQDLSTGVVQPNQQSTVTIPDDCPGQQLVLFAWRGDAQTEAQIVIDRLSFVKI